MRMGTGPTAANQKEAVKELNMGGCQNICNALPYPHGCSASYFVFLYSPTYCTKALFIYSKFFLLRELDLDITPLPQLHASTCKFFAFYNSIVRKSLKIACHVYSNALLLTKMEVAPNVLIIQGKSQGNHHLNDVLDS